MKSLQLIFFILFFCSVEALFSQEFGSNAINSADDEVTIAKANEGFKPDVSVTLGSSFMSFGQGYNSFGTFVMPEITFPVTKKFSVQAGIGYSTMFYNSPNQSGNIFSNNMNQYGLIYVSGIYQVNEKLSVAGTAYKTFDLNPKQGEVNPQALDFSNEGVNVNIDYKVNERLRINAGFSYQKSNSPFYNQMYPGAFNNGLSPFSNGMFGPGF